MMLLGALTDEQELDEHAKLLGADDDIDVGTEVSATELSQENLQEIIDKQVAALATAMQDGEEEGDSKYQKDIMSTPDDHTLLQLGDMNVVSSSLLDEFEAIHFGGKLTPGTPARTDEILISAEAMASAEIIGDDTGRKAPLQFTPQQLDFTNQTTTSMLLEDKTNPEFQSKYTNSTQKDNIGLGLLNGTTKENDEQQSKAPLASPAVVVQLGESVDSPSRTESKGLVIVGEDGSVESHSLDENGFPKEIKLAFGSYNEGPNQDSDIASLLDLGPDEADATGIVC